MPEHEHHSPEAASHPLEIDLQAVEAAPGSQLHGPTPDEAAAHRAAAAERANEARATVEGTGKQPEQAGRPVYALHSEVKLVRSKGEVVDAVVVADDPAKDEVTVVYAIGDKAARRVLSAGELAEMQQAGSGTEAAVPEALKAQMAQMPRGRDAEGGNDHWGYNPGDRAAHRAEMATARDNLDRLNNIPTAAEKAQMRADMAKKAARGPVGRLIDRLRGR
jgi:hypothetical protein